MPAPRLPHGFRSLGIVLFLWFFTIVIAAFAVYALVSVRGTSRHWREAVKSSALTSSELIQQATRVGMLRNHKEDVGEVVRTVAATPGVIGVRIYDKKGVIAYSADPREIGRRVDWSSSQCVACHQGTAPPKNLPAGDLVREYQDRDGRRVLGLINPIENAADCSNSGCHAHAPEHTILGVLDVQMSLSETDRHLARARNLTVSAGIFLALAVGGSSALFIQRFVRRPVQALIAGTERVAQGDLETRFEVGSQNEMGQLASAFNRMTRQLAVVQEENDEWSRTLEKRVVQETEQRSRAQSGKEIVAPNRIVVLHGSVCARSGPVRAVGAYTNRPAGALRRPPGRAARRRPRPPPRQPVRRSSSVVAWSVTRPAGASHAAGPPLCGDSERGGPHARHARRRGAAAAARRGRRAAGRADGGRAGPRPRPRGRRDGDPLPERLLEQRHPGRGGDANRRRHRNRASARRSGTRRLRDRPAHRPAGRRRTARHRRAPGRRTAGRRTTARGRRRSPSESTAAFAT